MIWEIIIILVGILIAAAGYLIPAKDKNEDEDGESISREQIQDMLSEEMESAKDQISGIVDETISYAIEKTERSMDRLSNEKMMAVNEYSDTVLEQINKSHEEVVFLYDMLNDKHETLKETVAEATKTATEVKTAIKEAEDFKPIVVDRVEVIRQAQADSEVIRQSQPESDVIRQAKAEAADTSSPAENVIAADTEAAPKAKRSRSSKKPVPVIKPEPVEYLDDNDDDEEAYFVEEEWEDFDDEEELVDLEGPEISFHSRTPGSRNSNERILELHKEGKSNMAIAKELGLGVGEVKLVIDLFKGL